MIRRIDRVVTTTLFWVLLAVGIALRVTLLFTNVFHLDSDNAIVYLIAKHISEGDVAWFFWGQAYGGTLLEFAAGGAMLIFGAHFEVLSIVGMLFFVAATFLVRQIATAAFTNRTTGNVAAILFWFSGYWTMRVGVAEPGFYGPSLALGLVAIWLALRGNAHKSWLQWALIGLAAGLALWQSPMGAAMAAPAVIVAAIRHRTVRGWLICVLAAIIGGLPWLIDFAINLRSAVHPQGSGSGTIYASFATVFTRVLPAAFSVADTTPRFVIAFLGIAAMVGLGVLAALALRRHNWWLATLFVSSAAVYLVTVVGTGTLLAADSVRYIVFLMPALALMAGWAVTRLPITGIVAMLLAVWLNFAQLNLLFPTIEFSTQHKYIVGDISGLGGYLTENHITNAYGDYWVAYAVTAQTNEAVKVAAISGLRRYTPYETDAAGVSPATVIVLADNDNDKMLQSAKNIPAFTRTVVDGYAIYTFAQPLDVFGPAFSWALY